MLPSQFAVRLPEWVTDLATTLPECIVDPDERMALAIRLSRENVERETGGPFGALVVAESSGRLIALGVNRVEPDTCSSAHAEIVALSLAQAALGVHDLADAPGERVQLVTSCEPCAMCLGAIPWSGVGSVLCGASKADAEATGFDEGERDPDWTGMLDRRGIVVETGLLRAQAAAVLTDYARRGGNIY